MYLCCAVMDFSRIARGVVLNNAAISILFRAQCSRNHRALRRFRAADTSLTEKNAASPLVLLPHCLRNKSAPRYLYSRPGNQDTYASSYTNTGWEGINFSLSLLVFHAHIRTHILFLSISRSPVFCHRLSFFLLAFSRLFSILLSISSSLSNATREHLNGMISPFAGNGAFGDAIRRATRWRSTSASPWAHLDHCRCSLGQGSSTICEHNRVVREYMWIAIAVQRGRTARFRVRSESDGQFTAVAPVSRLYQGCPDRSTWFSRRADNHGAKWI